MKYTTFCFIGMVLAFTFVAAPYVLASTLPTDPANDTRPSRLWGVTGPSTLPAGEAGGWNQDNETRPSQYTYFTLDRLRWSWGDGSVTTDKEAKPSNFHAYKKPGTYKAKLEGLDAQGKVIDTVNFVVNVTKAKKYSLEITKLDTKRTYKIGGEIPITYSVKNAPIPNIGAWVGFRLINVKTGQEFFLTDAWDARGDSGAIQIPGSSSYSQDGVLSPGKYRLEAYMYGLGTSKFPSVKSRPITILPE